MNGKNEIDKLFDEPDLRSAVGEIKFACLYDYAYVIINLQLDQNRQLNSVVELVCPYLWTDSRVQPGDSSPNTERSNSENSIYNSFSQQFGKKLNNLISLGTHKVREDVFKRQRIDRQVKCLQSAYLLKYMREKKKSDFGSYFDYKAIDNPHHKDQQLSDEEEGDENHIYSKKDGGHGCSSGAKELHVRVMYFVDANGEVQIVHLKESPDMAQLNQHYCQHIKAKIGHPHKYEKQDQHVVVTYMRDKVTYQDTKFIGVGLIDRLIKADSVFGCRQEQSKNSNYIIARMNQDQYFCAFKQHNLQNHKPTSNG